MVLEILTYTFIQKALIGGLAIAIVTALISPFLVLRKMSLLGDGLAHLSFGGVALGILLGINPFITAFVFSIVGALFVQRFIRKNEHGDAAVAVILSFGIGLGIILIGLSDGFGVSLFSYLIGSILTLSYMDLWIIFGVLLAVLFFIILNYKTLTFITLNQELAMLSVKNVNVINTIFTMLVAMSVVISIRAVGILLITALLVLPTLSALMISRSFKSTLLYAVLINIISVISGIVISYYLDIPPSGTIVFILLIVYMLLNVRNSFVNRC